MERIQEHLINTITRKVADDLVTQIDKGTQKIDPKSLPANFFYVSISAVLEYAEVSFVSPFKQTQTCLVRR